MTGLTPCSAEGGAVSADAGWDGTAKAKARSTFVELFESQFDMGGVEWCIKGAEAVDESASDAGLARPGLWLSSRTSRCCEVLYDSKVVSRVESLMSCVLGSDRAGEACVDVGVSASRECEPGDEQDKEGARIDMLTLERASATSGASEETRLSVSLQRHLCLRVGDG